MSLEEPPLPSLVLPTEGPSLDTSDGITLDLPLLRETASVPAPELEASSSVGAGIDLVVEDHTWWLSLAEVSAEDQTQPPAGISGEVEQVGDEIQSLILSLGQHQTGVSCSMATVGVGEGRKVVMVGKSGVEQEVDTLGGAHAYGFGANNWGQGVGASQTTSGTMHAFAVVNGETKDLGGGMGGWSVALAINQAGIVAGSALGPDMKEKPVVGELGSGNKGSSNKDVFRLNGLPTLGGGAGRVQAVSNGGLFAGWSLDSQSESHAVIWDAEGKLIDLNTFIPADSGWVLREAKAIVNERDVIGEGLFHGVPTPFVLHLITLR